MNANYSRHFLICLVLVTLTCVPTASAFYNPTTGRWLSRDPIEEDGGIGLYAFVSNRPQSMIDSLGKLGCSRTYCCCCVEDFVMFGPNRLPPDFDSPLTTMGHSFRFEGRFVHKVTLPSTSGRNTRCNVTWKEKIDSTDQPNVPINQWYDVLALNRRPDGTVGIFGWHDWNNYQTVDPARCPSSHPFKLSDRPRFKWTPGQQVNHESHLDLEFIFSSSAGCACTWKSIRIVLRQHLRVVGGVADWPPDDIEIIEYDPIPN